MSIVPILLTNMVTQNLLNQQQHMITATEDLHPNAASNEKAGGNKMLIMYSPRGKDGKDFRVECFDYLYTEYNPAANSHYSLWGKTSCGNMCVLCKTSEIEAIIDIVGCICHGDIISAFYRMCDLWDND